jgi:hypothetical protein
MNESSGEKWMLRISALCICAGLIGDDWYPFFRRLVPRIPIVSTAHWRRTVPASLFAPAMRFFRASSRRECSTVTLLHALVQHRRLDSLRHFYAINRATQRHAACYQSQIGELDFCRRACKQTDYLGKLDFVDVSERDSPAFVIGAVPVSEGGTIVPPLGSQQRRN